MCKNFRFTGFFYRQNIHVENYNSCYTERFPNLKDSELRIFMYQFFFVSGNKIAGYLITFFTTHNSRVCV